MATRKDKMIEALQVEVADLAEELGGEIPTTDGLDAGALTSLVYSLKAGLLIKAEVNKADADKLKNGLFKKLQDQLKKPIAFESTADVEKGFIISFDGGKSSFDFSDDSLAEFLSIYLNEEIASLLKKSISS